MDDSLARLQAEAIAFREERAWAPFHQPKDLVLGLLAEVGELAEVLLWKTPEELQALRPGGVLHQRAADEMADVLVYLLYLAEHSGVALGDAVRDKLAQNAQKYPVEKARGSARKYDEL